MTNLTDPIFTDEDAARKHFEAIRWPNGPVCPQCGVVDQATLVKGKSHRKGMYQCNACREPFTVTVGSVMESSHVPLHKWALGFHLMASSKKGVSANQLMRNLGLGSYRTAWFLAHRIREAMRDDIPAPMGTGGTDVQVDETFIFTDPDAPPVSKGRFGSYPAKINVLSLVDRASGRAASFVVDTLQAKEIAPILRANIAKEARLVTDEATRYVGHGRMFAAHASVHHKADEYVSREDPTVTTNHVEGYFSVFKRGMKGVYQHASKRHLHRYLSEFDFRYSYRVKLGYDDTMRAALAVQGAAGKRLTYKQPSSAQA